MALVVFLLTLLAAGLVAVAAAPPAQSAGRALARPGRPAAKSPVRHDPVRQAAVHLEQGAAGHKV